jgi:hypothetical protein
MTNSNRSLAPLVRRTNDALPFAPANHYLADCYLPLIHRLVEMRRERSEGIIVAFTSFSQGEGVTYVLDSLAWQLAQHTGEQILLTTASGLASSSTVEFWEPQSIQRLADRRKTSAVRWQVPAWETLQQLRARFGFVLVDCPPMRDSSMILKLPQVSDGIVLVVAAGESKPEEIEYARKALEACSANLLGAILNKRKNPLPKFLSKLF